MGHKLKNEEWKTSSTSGGKVTERSESACFWEPWRPLGRETAPQLLCSPITLSFPTMRQKQQKLNFLGVFFLRTYFLPWRFLWKHMTWPGQCLLYCFPIRMSTHMGLHPLLIHTFAQSRYVILHRTWYSYLGATSKRNKSWRTNKASEFSKIFPPSWCKIPLTFWDFCPEYAHCSFEASFNQIG